MHLIRKVSSAAAAILLSTGALAQNASDLIISEAMVENVSSVVDGYGRRTAWLELFNTSQGTVNFGGCFISAGDSLYMIPRGDLRTKLGPRQSVVIYCGGKEGDGTFFTGFSLRKGTAVRLLSNDGKTVIDSLSIPSDLPADMSARKIALDAKAMDWQADPLPAEPSPGALNIHAPMQSGAERMAATDPHGWILTVTSVTVVFTALLILWFIFSISGRFAVKAGKKLGKQTSTAEDDREATAAVIALALDDYLGSSIHDTESYTITINPTDRSAWAAPGRNFRNKPSR